MTRRLGGDLVVAADVHLGPDDPEVERFCGFLSEMGEQAASVVLLGDIFSLWMGAPRYTGAQHQAVMDACRMLRRSGVEVVFVEGNREYDVRGWEGDAFDVVDELWTACDWAGQRWRLAHGDLIDPGDVSNRVFRRVVRSRIVLGAVRRLPARWGLRLGHDIERALRHRNLHRKTSIREERLAAYGAWLRQGGFAAGVIGHIHVELSRSFSAEDGRKTQLYVLPDWRTTHRYLRVTPSGEARYESWRLAPDPGFAIIATQEAGGRARLRLERGSPLGPGTHVAVHGGHGPDVRSGRVVRCEESGGLPIVVVDLDPGPPVQVGDRLVVPPARPAPEET